ncbi:MAG: hypothetical protein LUE09_08410 [Synergistaceae bacterium]|nr:hypothetical protein [Synergistaceae bacterium]
MITVYGSNQCPKTVRIIELCKERGIETNYHDFEKDLKSIWEFVVIRDGEKSFDKTRHNKRLGIPARHTWNYFICENGFTFDGGEEPFDDESVMARIEANSKN